ncbi:hypothetical protein CWI84_01260 [Idiomarina tyrosinivorans]|uniref:DUF3080 domain-containing protein n=1 Tax=Idiomarina tyrosinivorans TaxID=1445662 RepID=A0A432ZUG5_9GAMM|nr:DUF3080 family protein [Idiomarina tyrosinivorans]RUO81416.1 hypothetical protein CWI84_01260 [Idiomarina tyrosinivorans]
MNSGLGLNNTSKHNYRTFGELIIARSLRVFTRYDYGCWLATLLLAIALTGCQPNREISETWQTYQSRLANTLAITTPPSTEFNQNRWRYPARRELFQALPPVTMNFLDSFRLGHCRAAQLLAKRNSALGKLQQGVDGYLHSVQLIESLAACVAEGDLDRDVASDLRAVIAAKRQQREQALANALATDDALRYALTPATTGLVQLDRAALQPEAAALKNIVSQLQASLRGDVADDAEQWNQRLKTLAQQRYLPQLWHSAIVLTERINALTPQLTQISELAGCTHKGQPKRATVARTLFLKFFSAGVQKQSAELVYQLNVIAPSLAQLQQLSNQPKLMQHIQRLQHLAEALTAANRAHVQPWQQFFADCGFTPGQSGA